MTKSIRNATSDRIDLVSRKSLVTANVFGKKPVYRLLETTRCYALEKLQESGEFDAVARRHAEGCEDVRFQIAAE